MFGIGSTELLVIFVVALIVLGPKSIPQIAKTLGKAMGEFKKVSTDFQRTMNAEVENEEHEKRKKEAEQELFGNKDKAGTPAGPVSDAPVTATAEKEKEPAVTVEAQPAAAPLNTETFAPDSPLAKALAKAEAEAAARDAATATATPVASPAAPLAAEDPLVKDKA